MCYLGYGLSKQELDMTIITRYVVEHKGVEKFVTTDKKEADQYDKMLDVADNLAEYIEAKGMKLDANVLEELAVMLSKNKDAVAKLFKGTEAKSLLSEEKAEVVALGKKKA
ncbi:MAG: dsDNA-binding SOS-regulon protein [Paraglaciecola sp.]